MKITTEHPFSYYIIPLLNGVELVYCTELDTDENTAIIISSINPLVCIIKTGLVAFKLKREAEKFKEEINDLLKDHGFMGFQD